MKKNIVFFVILCASLWAFDVKDLSDIKKDNIKGDFVQTKKITGFSKEIKSSGSFSIANNELLWHTKKPVVSSVKLTSEGIFTLQNPQNLQDSASWIKTSQSYDKSLFLNIMKLDFEALKNNFDFQITGNKNAWNLTLTPKGIIKHIFQNIKISGGEFVKNIVLIEANGDITENKFIVK